MERECNELKAAMRIAQSRQQALSLAALKTKEKASKSISSPRKKAESLQTLKDHNEHHLIEISRLTEELQHSRYDINRLKNDIKVLDEEKVVSTVQYDKIIATLKSEIINKQIENEEKMNNISTECSKIVYILDCLDNTVTQNSASLPKTSIGLLSNLRSRIQSIASLSSTTDSVDKMNSNREYITDNSTDNSNIKLVEICQALENENIEAYKNISALNIELKKTKQALESEMQVTKLIPQYRLGMVKIRNQIKEIYDQLNTEKLGNSTLQSQLKTLTNELNFYKEKHANDFIGNRRNNSILSKIQEREKEVIRIDEEIEKLKGEIEKKAKFTTVQLLMELINI